MKCSSIPDAPILRVISKCDPWANWPDIFPVLEEQYIPWKLQKAKLKSLIHRGLLKGCACGCRGEFIITEKGKLLITNEK